MNDLVKIEEKNIPQVFSAGGLDPILQAIRDEVTATVPDVKTAKGRKECASIAHKVARSKTYLDGLGKGLVSEIKAKAVVIDQERKRMRDALDALKDEVRTPLTEWEQAEQQRIDAINARIDAMRELEEAEYTSSIDAEEALAEVSAVIIDDSFDEYAADAAKTKDRAVLLLKAKVSDLKQSEEEAANLARLAAEKEERERIEREERIAKEAAEKAVREAKEAAELKEKQALIAAEAAKKREREMQLEIEQAKSREIEAKAYAKREAEEAARRAEQEKKEAIEAERQRLEDEQRKQAEEEEKGRLFAEAEERRRQEDKEHRRAINKEILSDLAAYTSDEEMAKSIIGAIASGYISHLKIEY